MVFITAYMNVWNSSLWLPWSIRGIYDWADGIVVNESCWVAGDWEGTTSPDGTADIVREFQKNEDPKGKVFLNCGGRAQNQPHGRNMGLHLVPPETNYIYQVDSDEFYMPEDLQSLRQVIEAQSPTGIGVPARCFYFDFNHCRHEGFFRGWEWFSGQQYTMIANMIDRGGRYLDARPHMGEMFHYSYVSTEWTRIKACMGEDVSPERYKQWWDSIYSQFDGSNLEELYERNSGGVHVFGGGPIEDYNGPHPPVLDNHPLRHWRWTK